MARHLRSSPAPYQLAHTRQPLCTNALIPSPPHHLLTHPASLPREGWAPDAPDCPMVPAPVCTNAHVAQLQPANSPSPPALPSPPPQQRPRGPRGGPRRCTQAPRWCGAWARPGSPVGPAPRCYRCAWCDAQPQPATKRVLGRKEAEAVLANSLVGVAPVKTRSCWFASQLAPPPGCCRAFAFPRQLDSRRPCGPARTLSPRCSAWCTCSTPASPPPPPLGDPRLPNSALAPCRARPCRSGLPAQAVASYQGCRQLWRDGWVRGPPCLPPSLVVTGSTLTPHLD
jgi:hypothetical protein